MKDLTEGPVVRHLIQLSLYMSVSMFLQTLYMLADLYWVGGLGKESIAALSLSSNLFFIVFAFAQVLTVGTTAMVSHAVGAKDTESAKFVFNQSTLFGVLMGIAVLIAAYAVRPHYFAWLTDDALTEKLGREYLLWLAPAFLAQLSAAGLSGCLRGIGDLKTPMFINFSGVALNVALDPVLIYGWGPFPKMGVRGAAVATLCTVAMVWVILLWVFTRKGSFLKYERKHWAPDWKTYSRLTKIGLPAGAEYLLMSGFMVLIFWAIRGFGTAAQAGYGVGHRLLTSLFLPVVAVSFANAPIVGQNFGARKSDRVRHSFYSTALLSMGLMLILTLVCKAAPHWMIEIFSDDPQVIAYGSEFVRIVSWNFVASAVILSTSSCFQGLGYTLPALGSSALRLVVFGTMLAWFVHLPGYRIHHVWWLWVGTVILQAGLNYYLVEQTLKQKLAFDLRPAEATPPAV